MRLIRKSNKLFLGVKLKKNSRISTSFRRKTKKNDLNCFNRLIFALQKFFLHNKKKPNLT